MSAPTDPVERWRRVAPRFTEVVDGVPADRWDDPTPCDGWVARDVIRHLVEWVPGFLAAGSDVVLAAGTDVDDDPAVAWSDLADQLQTTLTTSADLPFSHPQAGDSPLGVAIDRFVTSDVLVHTWDLAVATGQPARLDPELAAEVAAGMAPMTEMLVASGHYGPPIDVAPDADPTAKLVAVTGRDPNWTP